MTKTSSPRTPDKRARNPAWSRDELILALDLYLAHHGPSSKESTEIIGLSKILGRIGVLEGRATSADIRNANGVYMTMMNFRRFDPQYIASGKIGLTHGNRDVEFVWSHFAKDPVNLHRVANAIKHAVAFSVQLESTSNYILKDEPEAVEGWVLTRLHQIRERNRNIVTKKKVAALNATGILRCEACGFEFQRIYGERGRGFIECHHTRPLASLTQGSKTRLEDLVLLCANCHRMIHFGQPWLTIDELRGLIATR